MVKFNFKTKIKGFFKKLDPNRKDRYIELLTVRINNYKRLLTLDVKNDLSVWPSYISDKILSDIEKWYMTFLNAKVHAVINSDVESMKRMYKVAINCIGQW